MSTDPDLRLRPVDPLDPVDDDAFEQCVAVTIESARDQHGEFYTEDSAAEVRERHRLGTDYRMELVAACDGDTVVGSATLYLPLKDNTHLGALALAVAPGARRRGVGTALLREAERRVIAAGRRVLCGESDRPLDAAAPADAFLTARGYGEALGSLRSDLLLDDRLDAALAAVEAEAAVLARDYEVLTWWDGVPEPWLEARAALSARMSTDAPMGDRDVTPEVWDGARVREVYAVAAAQGRRVVESVAVHRSSRDLVAYTVIQVPGERQVLAYQWDTLVHAEHRGHRLGQLVKAANLRALRPEVPAVARVVTWNAAVNEPMLRVNRALGFVPESRSVEWQRHLP